MTTYYLPVVSTAGNWKYQFWRKTCLIHYSHLLVSPFTTGWNKRRRDLDENKKLTIYADSGGYQILTRHEKISALNVLRWQENIADIGITLDDPPHCFSNFTPKQFKECMKISNQNADLMYRLKVNNNMQLWGVIQGRTYDELNDWYDDLIKDHEYDGYSIALSIHNSTTGLPWIEQLQFAKTLKKRIHFLGCNERLLVLVLNRLSHLTGYDYTYDSSTFSIGGRYGKYIHPHTWKHISFSKDERKRDKIESLPCSCPICCICSPRDLSRNPELINLHNLHLILSYCETVNKLSDEQFFYHLRNLVKNEVQIKQIIDLLEISKNYNNMENYFDYKEKKC